jgi:group I intron endonuclease
VIVYLLRDEINGFCYVGKTRGVLKSRLRQHRTEMRIGRLDSLLYREMRHYGWEAFTAEILGERSCERDLNRLERRMIKLHNTVANGYNEAEGANGGRPIFTRSNPKIKLSAVHKKRIAESVRESWKERKKKPGGGKCRVPVTS